MRALVAVAAAVVLLSCEEKPFAFPNAPPPNAHVEAVVRRKAMDWAGRGAMDCGSSYSCAERQFSRNQPFHCLFVGGRRVYGWGSPGGGKVYEVTRNTAQLMFDRNAKGMRRRVGGAVRPPVPVSGAFTAPAQGAPGTKGLIIVETSIGADGRVEGTRVMKTIYGFPDAQAEEFVRGIRFQPATAFGVAVPVYYQMSLMFEDGRLRLDNPRPPAHPAR